jgi:protocatechuate 3,4-dioxygenase beta subunit
MKTINKNKRTFIKSLAVTGGLLGATSLASAQELCGLKTPKQPQGPFYPRADQIDKDADLTQLMGSSEKALGQVIDLKGRVTDSQCVPIANAFVEIWQACASGRYNHPADPNQAPLDPHFQYWGVVKTSALGEYAFRTILPGAYPADENWIRPPHIHFKVHKWGYQELITQLYFEGDSLNDQDLILQRIPQIERGQVVRPVLNGVVEFNLTLLKA